MSRSCIYNFCKPSTRAIIQLNGNIRIHNRARDINSESNFRQFYSYDDTTTATMPTAFQWAVTVDAHASLRASVTKCAWEYFKFTCKQNRKKKRIHNGKVTQNNSIWIRQYIYFAWWCILFKCFVKLIGIAFHSIYPYMYACMLKAIQAEHERYSNCNYISA